GAAAEPEMLRRLGTDALAASTPQASPPRLEEVSIEAPDRLTVADLLHPRVHGTTLREFTCRLRDPRRPSWCTTMLLRMSRGSIPLRVCGWAASSGKTGMSHSVRASSY